jgi:ribosome-binding protein aMBF1 (putative translation factor)
MTGPVTCPAADTLFVIANGMILIVGRLKVLFAGMKNEMINEQDILLTFGHRVREIRKSLGLSQEQLAEACALDRTYIGGIERGERNVALRNIQILARALGVSISKLTEGL